jgi:hypothetical protein
MKDRSFYYIRLNHFRILFYLVSPPLTPLLLQRVCHLVSSPAESNFGAVRIHPGKTEVFIHQSSVISLQQELRIDVSFHTEISNTGCKSRGKCYLNIIHLPIDKRVTTMNWTNAVSLGQNHTANAIINP